MSVDPSRSPIVIDTDVFSAELIRGSALAERYAPLIAGRPAFISFQTATEIRYGALVRQWGRTRLLALERRRQLSWLVTPSRLGASEYGSRRGRTRPRNRLP